MSTVRNLNAFFAGETLFESELRIPVDRPEARAYLKHAVARQAGGIVMGLLGLILAVLVVWKVAWPFIAEGKLELFGVSLLTVNLDGFMIWAHRLIVALMIIASTFYAAYQVISCFFHSVQLTFIVQYAFAVHNDAPVVDSLVDVAPAGWFEFNDVVTVDTSWVRGCCEFVIGEIRDGSPERQNASLALRDAYERELKLAIASVKNQHGEENGDKTPMITELEGSLKLLRDSREAQATPSPSI